MKNIIILLMLTICTTSNAFDTEHIKVSSEKQMAIQQQNNFGVSSKYKTKDRGSFYVTFGDTFEECDQKYEDIRKYEDSIKHV